MPHRRILRARALVGACLATIAAAAVASCVTSNSVLPSDTDAGFVLSDDGSLPFQDGGSDAISAIDSTASSDARADAPLLSEDATAPDDGGADAALGDVATDAPRDASSDAPLDAADDAPPDSGCGACNGTCQAGRCLEILASGEDDPLFIEVDTSNVYWQDDTAALKQLSLAPDAGAPITLATPQSGSGIYAFTVAGGAVYYTTQDLSGGIVVWSVPVGGGTSVPLATGETQDVGAMLVISNQVYVGTKFGFYVVPTSGVPDAGTAPSVGGFTGVAVSFADDGADLIALDRGSTGANGAVLDVPLTDGGLAISLASAQASPLALTIDSTFAYWTDSATFNPSVKRVPLAGLSDGGAPDTLATGLFSPAGIVHDATNLYCVDFGINPGTISRIPLTGVPDGGTPEIVASGPSGSQGAYSGYIAIDASYIYWTANGDGTIRRMLKSP